MKFSPNHASFYSTPSFCLLLYQVTASFQDRARTKAIVSKFSYRDRWGCLQFPVTFQQYCIMLTFSLFVLYDLYAVIFCLYFICSFFRYSADIIRHMLVLRQKVSGDSVIKIIKHLSTVMIWRFRVRTLALSNLGCIQYFRVVLERSIYLRLESN